MSAIGLRKSKHVSFENASTGKSRGTARSPTESSEIERAPDAQESLVLDQAEYDGESVRDVQSGSCDRRHGSERDR